MRKDISGIYAIVNKTNNKRYIGSSKAIYDRWNQNHLPQLRNNIHFNRHLQNAWNKYGEQSLMLEIVEECQESLLLQQEGYWIEHYKSWERENGYNLTRIVDDKQVFSEETIQKRRYARNVSDYWTTGANTEIVSMFKKGMSKNSIAITLGISRAAVYSCLEHHGLHQVNRNSGKKIKLTEGVKQQIIESREQGASWNEIVIKFKISRTQIYRTLGGDGRFNNKGKKKRETYRTMTADKVEKAKQLRLHGHKWKEIARQIGVTIGALYSNGVPQSCVCVCVCEPNKLHKKINDHHQN